MTDISENDQWNIYNDQMTRNIVFAHQSSIIMETTVLDFKNICGSRCVSVCVCSSNIHTKHEKKELYNQKGPNDQYPVPPAISMV